MTWTSTRTSVTFLWWNTRLQRTTSTANVKHTLFDETPRSDVYTDVTNGTFRMGVQGRGSRVSNGNAIYTIGTSDEAAYTESSNITINQ
jgi:hypothetical protein